tara:strand:+ start:4108 stop:4635 length:528 start_codon:yes stop_codon:yes gene_type:complete
MNLITVTGPSNSGKSEWAEYLASSYPSVIYIATSDNIENDDNWNKRISRHKARRPESWDLLVCNKDISDEINKLDSETLLIDSLGGYVSSLLDKSDEAWDKISSKFINAIRQYNGMIILVIEEVGWGLVSEFKVGNMFRDRISFLSRSINNYSNESWLVIQGNAINMTLLSSKVP